MEWCVPYTAEQLRDPAVDPPWDGGGWEEALPRDARRWQRAREMCETAYRAGVRSRDRYRAHLRRLRD
eukprot:5313029-Pyramimonas_sp.AAC.1